MAEEKKTPAAAGAAEEKAPAAKKAAAAKKPAAKPAADKKPAAEKKPVAAKPAADKKPAEKAAPAKKPAAKPAKVSKASIEPAAGTIKLTLRRALSGRTQRQIAVMHSLGLKRVGDVTFQPDNAATAGKIAKVGFLLSVKKA